MAGYVVSIAASLQRVVAQVPEARRASILRNGAVLTGGGAMLRNLDLVLSNATSLPVFVADEPLNCVAVGSGRVLENPDLLKHVLFKQE